MQISRAGGGGGRGGEGGEESSILCGSGCQGGCAGKMKVGGLRRLEFIWR